MSIADVFVNNFAKKKVSSVHPLYITVFVMMLKKELLAGQTKEIKIVAVKYIAIVFLVSKPAFVNSMIYIPELYLSQLTFIINFSDMTKPNTYKFKVALPPRFNNIACFIGYDPKSLAYTTEENPDFGEIVGGILAEEYETTDTIHRFRLRVERKLFTAKEILLKKPRCHLLLGVRCITAATQERDLIIATYMDLQPLKPFTWPRTCPTEILFYAIIQEKVKGTNPMLYKSLQTTPRIISGNFDWLFEKTAVSPSPTSSLASASASDCDDVEESGPPSPIQFSLNNPPRTRRYTDDEDLSDDDDYKDNQPNKYSRDKEDFVN